MTEAALYILTGLTLYGGAHHLYLGFNRSTTNPQLRIGALYLLLAAFAFSSALADQAPNLATRILAGKWAISLGIILWVGLVWHIALRSRYKPLLFLDALTAVWAIFLVRNITSPNSLLYADITPVQRTLLSGESIGSLFILISPWWNAVELAMLVSLVFCFFACYRLYLRGRRTMAVVDAGGLALLSLVVLFDHFVSVQFVQAGYLAPFGFLLFLLTGSLYPVLQDWYNKYWTKPAPIYNLTYMPDHASFHTDVAHLHAPVHEEPVKTHSAEIAPAQTTSVARETTPDTEPQRETSTAGATQASTHHASRAVEPASKLDTTSLHIISDNLIDIAVYATMALNRFKRGDADPQTLASLCKKVRSQAVNTRRLVNQLVRPELSDERRKPKR